MHRLLIAQTVPEIEALQPQWEWLHARQDDTTLFQSYAWNRAAVAVFHHQKPYVIFLETNCGAALIPAAIANRAQLCLLGEELFDYRDVLCAGDLGVLCQAWHVMAELGLPLLETPVRGLHVQQYWSPFERTDFCKAPYIPREMTAEAFTASHPRLGRQMRRLARAGVTLTRHDGSHQALLREIYRQKAEPSRAGGKNLFLDQSRIDCILHVAARDPSACQIFKLASASTLVAALVTFQDRNVRRFYTTWFNPMWSHDSPGIALLFEATRLSLGEGLSCDYMTGEQDYKLRLATDSVPLYRVRGTIHNLSISAAEKELPVAS